MILETHKNVLSCKTKLNKWGGSFESGLASLQIFDDSLATCWLDFVEWPTNLSKLLIYCRLWTWWYDKASNEPSNETVDFIAALSLPIAISFLQLLTEKKQRKCRFNLQATEGVGDCFELFIKVLTRTGAMNGWSSTERIACGPHHHCRLQSIFMPSNWRVRQGQTTLLPPKKRWYSAPFAFSQLPAESAEIGVFV